MKFRRIMAILLCLVMVIVNIPLQKVYGAENITYTISSSAVVYDSANHKVRASYLGNDISFTINPKELTADKVVFETDSEGITVSNSGVVTVNAVGTYTINIKPKSSYTAVYTGTTCTVEIVKLEPQVEFYADDNSESCTYDDETGTVTGTDTLPYVLKYKVIDPASAKELNTSLYTISVADSNTAETYKPAVNTTSKTISFSKVGNFTYTVKAKEQANVTESFFEDVKGEIIVKGTPIKLLGISNAINATYSRADGLIFTYNNKSKTYSATLNIFPAGSYKMDYESGPDTRCFSIDNSSLTVKYVLNNGAEPQTKMLVIRDIETNESISVPMAFGGYKYVIKSC